MQTDFVFVSIRWFLYWMPYLTGNIHPRKQLQPPICAPLLLLHPSSQTMVTYVENLKRELSFWILPLSIYLCKILIHFDRLIRWPPKIQSYPYPSCSSKDQHQDTSFKFIPSMVLLVWLSIIPYPGICPMLSHQYSFGDDLHQVRRRTLLWGF